MSDTVSHAQLYEDSKRFVEACWDNSNTRKAMHEFARDSDYQEVGKGRYRSVFYRDDLTEDTEAVVKFPNKIHALDESREHNLDEMRQDFAEVLECGDEGQYLVQRKSQGNSLLGALKLILKYRYNRHPSDDHDVILEYPWGEIE